MSTSGSKTWRRTSNVSGTEAVHGSSVSMSCACATRSVPPREMAATLGAGEVDVTGGGLVQLAIRNRQSARASLLAAGTHARVQGVT